MCYNDNDCYRECDACSNVRHRDDLILVTDGAVDPDEKTICAQCASKQLSALRNEVRAWRECRLWTDDNGNWKWYNTATSRLTEETNKALGIQ